MTKEDGGVELEHWINEDYEEHAVIVRGYLFRLCQDSDLADELTQETFYQAVRTVKNYRGDCKPSVWLCQIARHVWYKYLEKNKKYTAVPLEETISDRKEDMLDKMIQAETKVRIYQEIQKLPEDMREVLYLRILGELSYKEIAQVTGRTENWARVTFYRGKQQLMKGVKQWD